jgi:hypothetical protein
MDLIALAKGFFSTADLCNSFESFSRYLRRFHWNNSGTFETKQYYATGDNSMARLNKIRDGGGQEITRYVFIY